MSQKTRPLQHKIYLNGLYLTYSNTIDFAEIYSNNSIHNQRQTQSSKSRTCSRPCPKSYGKNTLQTTRVTFGEEGSAPEHNWGGGNCFGSASNFGNALGSAQFREHSPNRTRTGWGGRTGWGAPQTRLLPKSALWISPLKNVKRLNE